MIKKNLLAVLSDNLRHVCQRIYENELCADNIKSEISFLKSMRGKRWIDVGNVKLKDGRRYAIRRIGYHGRAYSPVVARWGTDGWEFRGTMISGKTIQVLV